MENILVLAEHRNGEIRDITYEMLGLAHALADDNNMSVSVLVAGHGVSSFAEEMKEFGEKVILMESPELLHYNIGPYLAVMEKLIAELQPVLTLIGHTAAGMDLAPALAARMSMPLATDCAGVSLSRNRLEVLRQVYGGKIDARLIMKTADQALVTVRTGAFPASEGTGGAGSLQETQAPSMEGTQRRRFIEYLEAELEDVDIAAAEVLVSVGRGIGKPENLPLAQDFADAIGATLSCSRPVADKGWLPKSRQVGTSGKTVKPRIYFTLGISGAFQHQAGMKNAGTIIAVNKDPKAPIFKVAHYGIVADLFQVLPLLKEKFAS